MVSIINQPWDGPQERVGDLLDRELANVDRYTSFTLVVAFAKQRGAAAFRSHIQRFLAQGRGVEAFVGIDALGTSREALELLLDTGATVHIFHNPGFTFHPKLYLLEGHHRAFAIVGSSNLTPGGLYTNYELGVQIALDLTVPEDAALHARLRGVVDLLRASPNCKDLSPDFLAELVERGLLGAETTEEAEGEAQAERFSTARRARQQAMAVFPRTPVPPPPRTVGFRVRAPAPAPGLPGLAIPASHFVMVLGIRDTRTRPGFSPDIFIPLAARDAEPAFWRWPGNYVRVQQTAGNYDERRVNILVQTPAGPVLAEGVRVFYYQERSEFRLNCSQLVQQAEPGDLLVIELPSDGPPNVDYLGSVVRRSDPAFPAYSTLAANPVPRSRKRWGYA